MVTKQITEDDMQTLMRIVKVAKCKYFAVENVLYSRATNTKPCNGNAANKPEFPFKMTFGMPTSLNDIIESYRECVY